MRNGEQDEQRMDEKEFFTGGSGNGFTDSMRGRNTRSRDNTEQ